MGAMMQSLCGIPCLSLTWPLLNLVLLPKDGSSSLIRLLEFPAKAAPTCCLRSLSVTKGGA